MRAVWGYYESSSIQGKSNSNMVRSFNALKRELTRQQNSLFIDHQQEDVVSGGFANTIQFHYLLVANSDEIYSGFAVTNTELTSKIATIDAAGHDYVVGDIIFVNECAAPYNGTHTVTGVTAGVDISYYVDNANIPSAVVSGSVTNAYGVFDANQGAVGTADVYFETRRDFYEPGRGF